MTPVPDVVLQRLAEWGVKRVYGCPGDGIDGLLGAERVGIAAQGVRRQRTEYAAHLPGRH
ncbi:hypothetical protein LMJ38_33095 [Streptomyces sp. R1]|uniref:hypothetical protein n=1 Tax=Streptomyces TaxID=1883 RepID=UPI00137E6FDD|nr:hypothetical protein [Streptomyces sp. R1]MCC8340737.1 hypothetical protein [Streptomyces sp. R1]MYS55709.1 hypothetical protein [Streptomyces sp. SID6013]